MRSSERALGVCVCCFARGRASLLLAAQEVFFYLFSFCSEKTDLRVRKRG